ncbi:MAG: hypothetical protein VW268_12925 [Rhodospirillaceae bacterium]
MSETDGGGAQEASQAFVKHLEDSGFFNQIRDLEYNLTKIAEELQNFGKVAQARMEESENLAAHILATEAILAAVLKSANVSADDVAAEVKERTAAISGVEEGSPAVHAIAQDILNRAG